MTLAKALALIQIIDPTATIEGNASRYYVSDRVEIGGDGMLMSPFISGTTPKQAVLNWLSYMQAVVAPRYLVVNATSPDLRRHYRWNSVGWQEVLRAKPLTT